MLTAGSGIPVRKARVTLAPDAGAPVDPVYSDNDGRFVFSAATPRHYILTAWKAGYAAATFGAHSFWDRPVTIAAVAGQTGDFTLMLDKGAAISGRVVDELGEPLIGMRIAVGRVTAAGGHPRLETGNFNTETDDLGEYRVGGLPPGTFAVAAYGFPSAPVRTTFTTPGGGTTTTMIRRPRTVFYPAAPLLAQARPITLKSGEDAGAADILFRSDAQTVRISGRILDPLARGGYFSLAVASDGAGIADAAMTTNTSVGPDGEFSMAVSPGEYTLVGQNESGTAIQHVTVGESDVSGIQLVLTKGARISGRVVFDGLRPPSARVFVQASSSEAVEGVAIMSAVAGRTESVPSRPDSTFTLTGVAAAAS